jgi:quinolinate synthase
VHAELTPEAIADVRAKAGEGAPVLVHPECARSVREAADYQLSTGGMCKFARESKATEILVGTEEGILHRLRKENPDKKFTAIGNLVCADMKKITLENLCESLKLMQHEVIVPEEISIKAKRAIDAMLAIK